MDRARRRLGGSPRPPPRGERRRPPCPRPARGPPGPAAAAAAHPRTRARAARTATGHQRAPPAPWRRRAADSPRSARARRSRTTKSIPLSPTSPNSSVTGPGQLRRCLPAPALRRRRAMRCRDPGDFRSIGNRVAPNATLADQLPRDSQRMHAGVRPPGRSIEPGTPRILCWRYDSRETTPPRQARVPWPTARAPRLEQPGSSARAAQAERWPE